MAIAVRRTYACPTCRESFTKWGLCQGHVRSSAPCRDALADQLKDADALQELCRRAAASVAEAEASGAEVASPVAGAGSPEPRAASTAPQHPESVQAAAGAIETAQPSPDRPLSPHDVAPVASPAPPPVTAAAPASALDSAPGRLSPDAIKRLHRMAKRGWITDDEHTKLDNSLERILADHSFAIQSAAMEKFFSLGREDLRHIPNKSAWLERCLQFCVRTNLAREQAGGDSPNQALIGALAVQAVLPHDVSKGCWDRFSALSDDLRRQVVAAIRSSVFANVNAQMMSDHIMNIMSNEEAISILEATGRRALERYPPQRTWQQVEGSLYHRVLHHLRDSRNSAKTEELVLRELAAADPSAGPRSSSSLLFDHESTADVRRAPAKSDADSDATLSALHAAAACGLPRVCARLIAEGLDVNERAGREKTPAHIAAEYGNASALRVLLAQRGDANIRDADGNTPLFWVVRNVCSSVEGSSAPVGAENQPKPSEQAGPAIHMWETLCTLLHGGAEETREILAGLLGEDGHKAGRQTTEQLAVCYKIRELRNKIQLERRLRTFSDLGDTIAADLRKLQYETSIFLLHVFERHESMNPDAAQLERRALISSEFIQDRDLVQRYGNRLARRLRLSKKAIDALAELPPQAGILALEQWKVVEVEPGVYDVPAHLNDTGLAVAELGPRGRQESDAGAGEQRVPGTGGISAETGTVVDSSVFSGAPRFQGKVRKWDSDRGFGFIVQDPEPGEETGRDVFVHRKNVIGSSPANHIDLNEGRRLSYSVGEPDGRPRALEVTMIDEFGRPLAIHFSGGHDSEQDRSIRMSLLDDRSLEDCPEPHEVSTLFRRFLKCPAVQEFARDKRPKDESWLRCVGLRRQNTGRRDDAVWKKEIERRIDLFLETSHGPLQKRDFDFRVRRSLLEFSVHNSVTRVSEALAWLESATSGKGRDEVRSWPAYVATLLRNFEPKLHEMLAERDRRSRTEPRRSGGEAAGALNDGGDDDEAVGSDSDCSSYSDGSLQFTPRDAVAAADAPGIGEDTAGAGGDSAASAGLVFQ